MAVTKDDTTQGAVAPTPQVISPGGQPPPTSQLQNQGVVPKPPPQAAPGVMRFEAEPPPHIPQPIPPQIMRSEAANATEILWSSRGLSIRAGKLPVQVVQQIPWTALAIAQSSLSNDQIEQVGQTIEATWAYLRAQVGTDEWMTAKARAMFIANPVARAEALDYMDRQSHGTGGMGSPFGRQTMAEAVELLSRDFEFQLPNGQTVKGPIAAYTNGHPFNSSWLSPPMNVVDAVLSTIFGPIDTASRGLAAGAGYVLGLLPHGVSAGLGAIGVNEDVSDRLAEAIQDAPTEVYEGVNTAFARATDVAGGALTLAMSQIVGRAPLPSFMGENLNERLEPIPFSDWKKYLWPEEQGTGFGRAMAQAGGLRAGDPGYDEIVSTVNFLGQLVLGAKVAKVTGAMKSALREGLPEGYGVAIEGGPVPGSQSPLTGTLAEQPFTLASEFRASLTQRYGSMGRVVYEMLAKEPDQWVNTGGPFGGKRRFNELNELVHQPNGVAKVVEVYRPGSYTIDMLESMRATDTIEAARQVYVRATQGLPDPMFRAQQLARLSELDKRIALIDELNNGTPEPRIGMEPPYEMPISGPSAEGYYTPDLSVLKGVQEPGYLYHWTTRSGFPGIVEEGLTPAFKTWEEGVSEGRTYLGSEASGARGMAGPHASDPGVFLRVKREGLPTRAGAFDEGYGVDRYTTERIAPQKLEYLGADGAWHSLSDAPPPMRPGHISEFGAEVSLRVRRDLESQRVVIANRMDRPFSAPPIRYPSKPIIMEMLGVAGDGPYSRFMSSALGKGRSWFQEGTNDPLTRPGTAPWAKERNASVLRKRANVAGLPRNVVRSLLDDLGKLPEGDLLAWERWVQNYHDAFKLSKNIDRALLDRFTTWGTKDPLEHAGSWIAKRIPDPDRPGGFKTIRVPVLEVKRFNAITGEDISVPMRNMTAMGLGDEVHVAPYDVLVDASSLYRKLIRKGKAASKVNPGHWAATVWDGGAFMMDSATAVFKSMALTGYGLRTIPLTTRILGEEILARTPGYMYQWFDSRDLSMFDVAGNNGRILTPLSTKIVRTMKGGPFRSPLAEAGVPRGASLGGILMDDHIRGMSSGYHWVSSMPDGRHLADAAAEGLHSDLMLAARSPEQRALLRVGPAKWVDNMLRDKDAAYEFLRPKVEQVWAERIGKDVAEFGVEDVHAAWMDYATTQRTYLEQLAGGNKNLIDAIRTGQDWKWLAKRDSRLLGLDQVAPAGRVEWTPRALTDREVRELVAGRGAGQVSRTEWDAMSHGGLIEMGTDSQGNVIYGFRSQAIDEWVRQKGESVATAVPDKAIRERYGNLLTDEARYRANLKGAIEDGRKSAELGAAREVWMKSLDDLRAIEREHGIPINWGEASFDKPKSFQQALQRATENGEYMPPQQVRVIYHDRKTTGRFGEDVSGLRNVLGSMADAASTFGYWPMAKVTSPLDIRWARGPLYKKAARDAYDRMRAGGWDRERALALAKYQGAETARRIMYDLGATSRFDKAVRNIFWFLPAYRELMATWMIKIPSQYYWPVGAAYLANRAHLVVDWLSGTGLIQQNKDGEWQTSLPFMGTLLNHLTGTDTVKHIVTMDPGSLNFVASGPTFHGVPLPGFSKQYNVLLTQLALRNPETWKGIADVMLPYGPDVTLGTPALNNFYYWLRAQTGDALPVTPPWDHFWPQHSKAQWDLAADDALRVARTTVGPPPNMQDERYAKDESGHMTLPAQRLYERDWDAWKDDMQEAKQRILQATFSVRMLGSTVFPASLQVSNNYKEDANALLDELYGHRPDDYYTNPGTPEAIAWKERRDKAFNAFLKDHPDGFFFLVNKTAQGENAFDPYRAAAGEDDFWMEIFKDYRITLDEDTYLERASGMESYRWMTANVNADFEQMGGDAPAILRNWYERSSSLETRSESWQDYLTLHPEFDAFLKNQSNIWAQDPKNKLPDLSLQAERLLQAHSALKSIDELFSVDGIRNKDVRQVEHMIADILFGTGPGQEGVNFGPPRTQVEKDVAWWWSTIGRPYLDKVNTLVDSAFAAQGLGDMELAGTYWSKIRDMANASPGVSHNGMAFPSAQEVFWGSKTLQEQHRSVLAWQTKPIAWLTNFQRGKAGWGNVPGANDFFDKADEKWDAFYDFVQDEAHPGHYIEGYSPNSKAYDRLYNETKNAVDDLARQSGPAIYDLYRLNIAAPALRLATVGNSPAIFDALAAQASDVSEAIEAEGFSPKGWGETATELKISFFKSVESAWRSNAGLHSYLKNVMHVMLLPGGDIERDGALLYDALFFGNFKPPGQIGSIPAGFTSSFSSLTGFQPPTPTTAPTGGAAPSGGYGGSSGGIISPGGTGG